MTNKLLTVAGAWRSATGSSTHSRAESRHAAASTQGMLRLITARTSNGPHGQRSGKESDEDPRGRGLLRVR
jgi:hypothetical protein